MEEAKRQDDICGRESLEAKGPVVRSSAVDKNKSIMVTADSNAVPKGNVHMHSIEVMVHGAIKEPIPIGFWNGGILGTQRGRELASINPFTATTDLKKMLVVSELATAHDTMELLCGPVGFSVGGVGGIARSNQRERSAGVAEKVGNLVGGHSGQKARGGFVGGIIGRNGRRRHGVNS
jgi:hypothetical protein